MTDWMVFLIPFSISRHSPSLQDGCAPGAEDSGGTTLLLAVAKALLQMHF